MILKTLIIDDEPIALEKLKNYVGRVPSLELSAKCSNGFEAIEFLGCNDVDLIITDINMPDLNGMDFVKALPKRPMIVFTTAHAQYAVDSYRLSAIDYLLKPYGFVEFNQAITKAIDIYKLRQANANVTQKGASSNDTLFIKTDTRYIRVRLSEIRFIKGYGEYLLVFVEGRINPLVTLSSFASIRESLSDNFLQVHRSYIVNMDQVEHIERSRVIMDSDNYVPVGDSYKVAFQEYLMSHTVGKSTKKD